ncbi:MAG: (d)CMP kinase [Bacteroidetes bacterium]|jgi:CMP/dCMP kinase|nr:(d)CMP kinase [Bacteroidota bacterium]MBT6686276.1 (d)CMP kinase [Bacteroidota bacterium]MBT7142630.1 (d)CMP kinase [Bacteroidota bacterium]MBT7492784.1 (d)CMP kinase [Bacteroidota bacterium]
MKIEKNLIIAIDGHSSCGKSTIAKDLAKTIAYTYIDSGAMYRAVTLFCLRNNIISNDKVDDKTLFEKIQSISISFKKNEESGENEIFLNDKNVESEIRALEVANYVSQISKIKEVRVEMVKQQQEMGKQKRIVMDGRDIGTVVFPDADIKIFMTASVEIRAQRRYDELIEKDINTTYLEVFENIKNRDFIDENRKESPLKMDKDAMVLDNSKISRKEQLDWILKILNDFQK